MRSPRIGTTMRSFRPAIPSAAVAASAMTSGGNTATARSVSALRLLLWCSDSMQAGAHGVGRLGPTGMHLQPASHANCNGNSIESTHSEEQLKRTTPTPKQRASLVLHTDLLPSHPEG